LVTGHGEACIYGQQATEFDHPTIERGEMKVSGAAKKEAHGGQSMRLSCHFWVPGVDGPAPGA